MKLYSAYKDLGIEWLGKSPSNWDLKKLKFNASVKFSSVDKKTEEGEQAVRLCNYVDVYYNDVITPHMDFMEATASPEEIRKFRLKAGDVLVTKDSEEWDDIAIPAYVGSDFSNVICGYHLAQIRPNVEAINGKFLFYLFESYRVNYQFKVEATGVTRYGLSNYALSNALIVIPPVQDQEAIVGYLDRKTAQIDALIAKKERMMELLREERAAIVSQVVTKGLNPKAEMKDSGIDWLGTIPKHWDMKKLKFNAAVQFSNVNKKSEDGESSVRLCNYVDVYYNDFITPDLEFMEATASPEEINKFHLRIGDVLLTKDSEEWNDIAIPAYMTFEAPDLICGYHLAQVRPQKKVLLGKYLFWLLSANCINYQFQIEASGVTRYGLSNYALSNSLCLIPPEKEQEAIAIFLDKKTAQIDDQVTRAQKSIELLKEYRTSLISEVVTGKIDVRERSDV